MSNEQPYDPYIPAGGNGAAGASAQHGNQRTAALQAVSFKSKDIIRTPLRSPADHRPSASR